MLDLIILTLKQYGVWGLVLLTFLDAFISPIPPEVLLIPLSLVNPENALWLALVTTLISVVGALLGYWIGLKGGKPVLNKLFSKEKINKAEQIMQSYGVMAILIASFTPIPYKIITISSGVLGLPLKKLIFWSILGRGARFFLEALLIIIYGSAVKDFIQGRPFSFLTIIIGGLVLAVYLIYTLRKSKRLK